MIHKDSLLVMDDFPVIILLSYMAIIAIMPNIVSVRQITIIGGNENE